QLLKDGFVVNTILKEADLFCPNSVRINFTIYHFDNSSLKKPFCRLVLIVTIFSQTKSRIRSAGSFDFSSE
ncbi:hypothetical protein EFR51_09170, partial [Latilactobacillus curvatus]|nr:hypothetical protein [Latilactobacillus curvatus]